MRLLDQYQPIRAQYYLLGEVLEALHDDAGVVAVPHVDTGRPHPGLQVIDAQRDVLRLMMIINNNKSNNNNNDNNNTWV